MAKFRLLNDQGEITLKYTVIDRDRHGNCRIYFRTPGEAKIRLHEQPGTDAFFQEYRLAATDKPSGHTATLYPKFGEQSLAWLSKRYFESAEFKRLHETTKRARRRIVEHIVRVHGNKPYRLLEPKHVRRIRDLKAEKPEAANGLVKALRAIFAWAVSPGVELAKQNPARDVPYICSMSGGYHSWTDAEILRFEIRHPIGTSARLALALLLYTGQRRSDVVLLGPQHAHDGWLHFTQQKNKSRKPVYLEIPIQRALQEIIDATELGNTTFLVNARGREFSVASFGNWFRNRCDEAGLMHCSAHGLRKAAARRLAENDRSSHQIMAITGHRTLKEVDRYTRAANQRKLAGQAFSNDLFEQMVPSDILKNRDRLT